MTGVRAKAVSGCHWPPKQAPKSDAQIYEGIRSTLINAHCAAGRGCVYCKTEADKEYKRQFPDGPKPIATFDATPEGIAAAKEAIGKDAIEKAFGPDGDGIGEIMKNIAKAKGGNDS